MIVVRDAALAHAPICSRTYVERHVELLRRAGIMRVHVVAADAPLPPPPDGRRLLVAAERLFDARLYRAVIDASPPVRLMDGAQALGLEALERGVAAEAVDVASLPTYSRELRRALPMLWHKVTSAEDRQALTHALVEASGKGHQDLPAMLINAPLEKAIVRRLAPTRITPNQLTALCNVVAFAVAGLLASGHLLAGIVGALVVGVIDGLDGRQARVQVRTSEIGRLEHLFDKVYEILWMVALAYALDQRFPLLHAWRGVAWWVAAYLADTAAYDLVKWRTGVNLDESSRSDRLIRLVAGRRNVYVCLLLAGVLAGRPDAAWRFVIWWAAATALVHAVRAGLALRRGRPVLGSLS